MGQPIVNAISLAQTGGMSSTQYNSLAYALAEFIDNSIEGKAKNIFIIFNDIDKESTRTLKDGYTITILDDGEGINSSFFPKALTRGESTKLVNQDDTIGRFGLGMKEAGNFIASRIELYTWQEYSSDLLYIYYDNEEVIQKKQLEIPTPVLISKTDWPKEFDKYRYLKFDDKIFDFTKSGVMIQLKKQIYGNHKKPYKVYSEIEEELGRIFKKPIDNGLSIYFIDMIKNTEPMKIETLDCTFTLPTSYKRIEKIYSAIDANLQEKKVIKDVLSGKTTLFEVVYEGSYDLEYIDHIEKVHKKGKLSYKVTKIRDEFYYNLVQLGGGRTNNIKLSDFLKDFGKISIMRAGRELAFDIFKFVQVSNNPQHRWWGLEISFEPILDALFKVAKNKQGVVLNKTNSEELSNHISLWNFIKDNIITKYLDKVIKMNSQVATQAKNDLVDIKHKTKDGVEEKSISSIVANKTYQTEKSNPYLTTINSPRTPEQLELGSNQKIDFKIDIIPKAFRHSELSIFIDYVIINGKMIIYVNTNHLYYSEFYAVLGEFEKEQFNCFLLAIFKSIDEMIESEETNRELIKLINKNITNFIAMFLEEIRVVN